MLNLVIKKKNLRRGKEGVNTTGEVEDEKFLFNYKPKANKHTGVLVLTVQSDRRA